MPKHIIHWNAPGNGWGTWQITEGEEDLQMELPESELCPPEILNPRKRLEWLSGRVLLKSMVEEAGIRYPGIQKDEFGKPSLTGLPHQISLSNSFPYVAAQLHPDQVVGIDLEQPRPKLFPVMKRVLTADEWLDGKNDLMKLCVYWCSKEALYKIYGRRNLLFTEHLLIKPFTLNRQGQVEGRIVVDDTHQTIVLNYRISDEFILVTTDTETT